MGMTCLRAERVGIGPDRTGPGRAGPISQGTLCQMVHAMRKPSGVMFTRGGGGDFLLTCCMNSYGRLLPATRKRAASASWANAPKRLLPRRARSGTLSGDSTPEGPWHPHVECRGAPQPDPITEGLFEGSPPTFRGGCRDKVYGGRAKLSARLSKAHDRGVAFAIGSPETVRSGRRDGVQLG